MRTVRQGDLYWVEGEEPDGSEAGYTRPYVVIQNDHYNASRLRTVIVCPLTTNLRRANSPENVLLNAGEGGLRESSVVVLSQISVADKTVLGEYIGTLPAARVSQILEGLHHLTMRRPAEEKASD